MTVEFLHPETQSLIEERMAVGHYKDIEAVVLDALRTAPSPVSMKRGGQALLDVFAEGRQILDGQELDFSRDKSTDDDRGVDFA